MRKVSSSENKEIVLGILSYIDNICRENSIEYSLGAGTLLGGIRNGGFIPWDDDGDVIVRRNEYDRLMKILKEDTNSQYGFMFEETSGYYYVFAKVYDKRTILKTIAPQDAKIQNLGVYVDIFPIDKVPSDKDKAIEFYKEAMNINYSMYMAIPGFYSHNNSFIKRCVKKVLYYPKYKTAIKGQKDPEIWKERLLNKIKSYEDSNESAAGFTLSEYAEHEYMDAEIFDGYEDITFEGIKYRRLKKYKRYLTALYGNYMQLPPEDKRKPKHAYIEFWK